MKTSTVLFTIVTLIFSLFTSVSFAEKPRLAIQDIIATPAVIDSARVGNQINVLNQILQGSDSLLATTINQTKRFDIVARSKYKQILKEQAIADSGDVDPSDPQAAKAFMMAGAKYVATVTVDNYQDQADSLATEGGFGRSSAEVRSISLQATLQIFDTTTAVMLSSTIITLSERDVDEKMAGANRSGRGTNALIGKVTKKFATMAANAIMDNLVPAKVIGYTMGNITFTRGEGTGVEIDQIWQVFHAGEEMIDEDTGESFGAEEIAIGWARVSSVHPKFSKATAIQDYGINKGNLIRHVPAGLPSGVDPNGQSSGSSGSTGGGSGSIPSTGSTPQRTSIPNTLNPDGSKISVPSNVKQEEPVKLALFIRDISPEVPDSKVEVLETFITAWLTDQNIAVINRAEVLNAVSSFAKAGANKGTGDSKMTEVERMLSDQTSAAALARNLGADGLLIATITSLIVDKREIRDPARGYYDNIFYTLDVTWNVLDGGTGASVASGIAQARDGLRQYENQTRTFNIDTLLRADAEKIGKDVRLAMANPTTRKPSVIAGQIPVQINIALSDLSIPELIKQDNGEYIVGANRYQLEPMACNVLVDGMLAGTAPGVVQMTAGAHRIRIERPMVTPVDQFIVVREGMSMLTIPVKMSDEGRRQWKEQAMFFESLKTNAVMREAELEKAKGFAEFMRNSKLNLDTSGVKNVDINSPNVWQQLINE